MHSYSELSLQSVVDWSQYPDLARGQVVFSAVLNGFLASPCLQTSILLYIFYLLASSSALGPKHLYKGLVTGFVSFKYIRCIYNGTINWYKLQNYKLYIIKTPSIGYEYEYNWL